jgi:CheY-like chemotaxis protein
VVSNPFTALDELKRAAEMGEPFRLVLLDCMMPDMDGFELAEHIRADRTLDDCVMIMASSGASPNHAERCREFRIARYMLKPVVQSELLQAIVDLLAQGQEPDLPSDPDPSGQSKPRLNILLVEDGLVNQKVAMGMLKDHDVVLAENGQEAIEQLQDRAFDLVLMDVQMPVMDGLEATARIREQEVDTERHIPIIAMTASAMKGDRERCLEAGMDGYISKPVTKKDLAELVRRYASGRDAGGEPQPHSAGS